MNLDWTWCSSSTDRNLTGHGSRAPSVSRNCHFASGLMDFSSSAACSTTRQAAWIRSVGANPLCFDTRSILNLRVVKSWCKGLGLTWRINNPTTSRRYRCELGECWARIWAGLHWPMPPDSPVACTRLSGVTGLSGGLYRTIRYSRVRDKTLDLCEISWDSTCTRVKTTLPYKYKGARTIDASTIEPTYYFYLLLCNSIP